MDEGGRFLSRPPIGVAVGKEAESRLGMVGVTTAKQQVLEIMRNSATVWLLVETACMNNKGEVGLLHALVAD
jgi:hypothetical protein